ncbi:MAG: SPASM domain-containing protein, partial [Phycisphaerales bacterium]
GRDMGIENLVVDITKLSDDPEGDEVRRFREVWGPRVRHVLVSGINKVQGNAYLGTDGVIRQIDDTCQRTTPVYCGNGQRLIIHWNGDFGFCCSDVNGELKLGNIHDRTIRQVWRSPEIERIRAKILAADYAGLPPCEVCSAGGCWSSR